MPKGNKDNNMALAGSADPAVATDIVYRSPDNNDCSCYKILATKLNVSIKEMILPCCAICCNNFEWF